MKLVGITGGIGSGKTVVCKIFETLNIPVYYSDDRAKWLMENDRSLKQAIVQLLGTDSFLSDGRLNRQFISAKVFEEKLLLERLNQLVHPVVKEDKEGWSLENSDAPYLLNEAALLVETGFYKELDSLIVVACPEEVRIARVMERDSISAEQVRSRIKNQLPEEEKLKVANYVIWNDGTRPLIPQVLEIHQELRD